MTCPICKKHVATASPELPFCSDHCREVDLGYWAMEKYVIPSAPLEDELPDDDSKFGEA